MALKGGMNGVHQVRFWWKDHSGLEAEEADFLRSQKSNQDQYRMEILKRSELIKAFHANAPDVRSCKSEKAKRKVIEQFLNSKSWQKIYREIMK